MISIQQMHYIIALSETRHFQRASEVCFITQPTLSMQIKKAEDDLGFAIFDRSRQPLELTSFGKKLLPILREILAESEKIGMVREQMQGTYRERIKMGIIPTISSYMIPDLFATWKGKLQEIQLSIIEMKTEELITALDRKELDVIILAGPYADTRLRTIPLYVEEILVYSPEIQSEEVSSEELRSLQPWLLSSGNCLRNQMIRICELKDDPDQQFWSYEGGNMDLLINMADRSGGYTLIPENMKLSTDQKRHLHRVHSIHQDQRPAREIIAALPSKSLKWESIEKMIREIQLCYNKKQDEKFEILNWK
jgi:LysR family hydrogen peroxide-inducible transcriptional activator